MGELDDVDAAAALVCLLALVVVVAAAAVARKPPARPPSELERAATCCPSLSTALLVAAAAAAADESFGRVSSARSCNRRCTFLLAGCRLSSASSSSSSSSLCSSSELESHVESEYESSNLRPPLTRASLPLARVRLRPLVPADSPSVYDAYDWRMIGVRSFERKRLDALNGGRKCGQAESSHCSCYS